MFLVSFALAAPPFPIDLPGESDGALSGTEVYLSQCHGWIWYDSLDDFSTQRGNVFDTVEDFHNPEAANQSLAPYLHNAGADVWMVKERDLHDNWAIADNDGDGYTESGGGGRDGLAGFADWGTWAYGEDPFDGGTTRILPAGTAATFSLKAANTGWQALYVAYDADSDFTDEAVYTVSISGIQTPYFVDQRSHGSTWRYLGTHWLENGQSMSVTLEAASGEASADAVRLGGGSAIIERHGQTSGRPNWEEGAISATQFNGAPTSVYDPYGDGNGSDPSARPLWAQWEHPSGTDAVYVSWHSNACTDCDARGTGVYTYNSGCSSGSPTEGSQELAELLQEEIVAVGLLWDPEWQDRGTKSDCFSEVNPSLNDEMPATLIEIAFHDTEADVEILKDPAFRIDAGRAIYRAIARYFEGDGVIFLPEPPLYPSLVNVNDGLRLSWTPGWNGDLWGNEADSYLIQTSPDGRTWNAGQSTNSTTLTLDVPDGELIFARIVAVNAGGYSFPSTIVAARRGNAPPVLLVNAFDRLDTGLLAWEDLGGSLDEVRRMDLAKLNAGDILVSHATAVDAAGYPFDSVEDEALPALDAYQVVIWATAEESTADATFSDPQQTAIRAFVADGGGLWASGAELLWDLDEKGDAGEQAFAAEVLGVAYESDDCACTSATGVGILSGITLDFGGVYDVEYADSFTTDGDSLAQYPNGAMAAAISGRVAVFGFPFEAVRSAESRDEVASRLLPLLAPDWEPPIDTGGKDTADEDSGDEPGDTGEADSGGNGNPRGPPGELGSPAGCGCQSATSPVAAGAISLLLAGLSRRRAGLRKA